MFTTVLKKKSWGTMLGVALGALALTGCGSSGSASSTKSAAAAGSGASSSSSGLVLAGDSGLTSDPYWITVDCGGTRAAQANGAKITWKGFTTQSATQDTTNMQAIQLSHPDGVIFSNPSNTPFQSQRQQWMTTGVPVVEINSITSDPYFYTGYNPSPEPGSVLAFAKLIAKDVGKSGSFVVIGGQAGVPFLEAGWKPVLTTLHRIDPGVQLLPTQYDNFDTNKTASIVSGLLVAHPDLKGIYGLTGIEGTGAISALQQANKQGKVDVFSGSGNPNLVAGIKSGTVTALLAQTAYLEGYDGVQTLVHYLKSHKGAKGTIRQISPKQNNLPTKIITKANVNDAKVKKDYEYLTSCS